MSKGDGASKRKPRLARIDEDFIKIIAQCIPELPPLKPDVHRALAADAEYRLRELIQRSKSFMAHSKRRYLAAEDISAAFKRRGTQPILGYGANKNIEFRQVQGAPGLFVPRDDIVKLEQLITAELPSRRECLTIEAKWLALEGKHVLNGSESEQELVLPNDMPDNLFEEFNIFAKAVGEIINDPESTESAVDAVLREVAVTKNIHPVLSNFIDIIRQTVHENARASGRTEVLFNVTRLIYSVLSRDQFGVEAYYDQILPALLTCVLGRRLGIGDHWSLRDYAAFVLQETFRMHEDPVSRGRTAKTIVAVLTDKLAPLESIYGAIRGLAALGQDVFRNQFLPHMPALILGLERASAANSELEGDTRAVVDEKISLVCQAIDEASTLQRPEEEQAPPLLDATL